MESKKISFGFMKIKKVEKPFTPIKTEEKRDFIECIEEKSIKVVGKETVTEDLLLVIPMKPNTLITAEKLKQIADKVENSIQEPEIKEEPLLKEQKIKENETLELMQEVKKDVKVEVPNKLAIPTPAKPIMTGEKETNEIIAKVYHRMKYEAENGVEKLTDARWRTAQAVGFSESTITRILKEEKQANTSRDTSRNIFKSPSKPKRMRTKSNLDGFDVGVLRRTIMKFHTEFKELPTLRKLKRILTERIGFNGCIETLRKILKESGYEWSKIYDNRKALVEKHDIQMLRFQYLKQLKKYRDEGRYIVFTNESYVHTKQNKNMSWKPVKGLSPPQKKISKGIRVIIVHAGGCEGFVPNASLVYEANSTSGDYHDNMNLKNYKKWLTTQLLPNLPVNAVIVMDNAAYHNALSEKAPTSNSNMQAMKTWLVEKNIPFDKTMKKIELYDLILKNKDRFKSLIIDELIRSKGFEILRLPPYHPELNPIEKIWGILKNYVANKNISQNLTSIMALINERLEMIDRTMWANTCRHVEDTEKQYIQCFNTDYEFINYVNGSNSDESDLTEMSE